mmetsp:Transcript_12765/g.38290  ORF Transcript_12765/g.38290 Transcript_12765/m.38290 type:complete len:118 (-) Transcript_12765:1112-1465(-)
MRKSYSPKYRPLYCYVGNSRAPAALYTKPKVFVDSAVSSLVRIISIEGYTGMESWAEHVCAVGSMPADPSLDGRTTTFGRGSKPASVAGNDEFEVQNDTKSCFCSSVISDTIVQNHS